MKYLKCIFLMCMITRVPTFILVWLISQHKTAIFRKISEGFFYISSFRDSSKFPHEEVIFYIHPAPWPLLYFLYIYILNRWLLMFPKIYNKPLSVGSQVSYIPEAIILEATLQLILNYIDRFY